MPNGTGRLRAVVVVVLLISGGGALGQAVRGVTISCFRSGPGEWDQPAMRDAMLEIQSLGAGAIAVHPYGRIRADGSLHYRDVPDDPIVLLPGAWAGELGLTYLVKPHVAYWGSGFSWRGAITFDDEAQWAGFFADYERFIVHQAQLAEAAGAQWFAVGTELCGTVHHEAQWRRIIAEVRQHYNGKLTYAANWDRYREVPFWDALDAVGIQAYFPLRPRPAEGAEAAPPTDAELRAGWQVVLAELRAYAAEVDRPILLTELGYADTAVAVTEPWASHPRTPEGAALKLRAMAIGLEAIAAEPSIHGVFLWKWFPTPRAIAHDFMLQYPAMKAVLRQAWG